MNIALPCHRQFPSTAEMLRPDRTRSRPHLEAVRDLTDAPGHENLATEQVRIANRPSTATIVFGAFRLLPAQRLLLEGNTPVRLGSRALEILIALVEQHGELVSKNALMARVWPDTTVVEANLSVHVAALRRALRDGRDGNRYLVNMPGRGYRFVAPITRVEEPEPPARAESAAKPFHNPSKLLTPVIGPGDNITEFTEQPAQGRLANTAPGGTAMPAVAPAPAEMQNGPPGLWLIDFGSLTDPGEVARVFASALGVEDRSEEALSDLVCALKHKRILLVLDPSTRGATTADAPRRLPRRQRDQG